MESIGEFIAKLGFPIFVAVWLMIRDVYFLLSLVKHMQRVEALLGAIAANKEET